MTQKIIRFAQLSIIVSLVLGSAVLWFTSPYFNDVKARQYTHSAIRDILEQASLSATVSLNLENDANLNWLVQHLVQSDHIVSTSIFSHNGSQVAFAYNPKIIKGNPDLNQVENLIQNYTPYVKMLYRNSSNIGYIRIRLSEESFMTLNKNKSLSQTQYYQYVLIIISAILFCVLELLRMPKSWYKKELEFKS